MSASLQDCKIYALSEVPLESSGIKVRAMVSLVLGQMGKRGLERVSASLNSIICLCLK